MCLAKISYVYVAHEKEYQYGNAFCNIPFNNVHFCGYSIPVMVKSKHPSAREAAMATMTKNRSRRILILLFTLPILQQLISSITLLGLSLNSSEPQKTQL